MKRLAIIALAIAPLASAIPSCDDKRPSQTIYVGQTYPITFRAESGDIVNVIMNDDSEELAEQIWCDDSGGSLERNPHTDILICFDIDF